MGTKTIRRKVCGIEKLNQEEVNSLKGVNHEDSLLESPGKDFTLSNEPMISRHVANDDAYDLKVYADVNNHEMVKKKKKKKRESEQSGPDIGTQKIRDRDEVNENHVGVCEIKDDLKKTDPGIGVNMDQQSDGKIYLESNFESVVGKDRLKNHNVKSSEGSTVSPSSVISVLRNNSSQEVDKGQKVPDKEDISEVDNREHGDTERKTTTKQMQYEDMGDVQVIKSVTDKKVEHVRAFLGGKIVDNVQSPRKERKKRRQQDNVDLEAASPKNISKTPINECNTVVEDRCGVELAETEAGEEMPRAGDGKKDKKKRKKERNDGVTGVLSSGIDGKDVGNDRELLEENIIEKAAENRADKDSAVYKAGEEMPRAEYENKDKKKRKKWKRQRDVGDNGVESGGIAEEGTGNEKELLEENIMGEVEHSRKERKKKNKLNIDVESTSEKTMGKNLCNESSAIESKAGDAEIRDHSVTAECGNEVKTKKVKLVKDGSDEKVISGREKKMSSETTDPSVKSALKGTSKRVRFSEDVEIFPSSDGPCDEGAVQEGELVRGKRFSREEDEMVKEAVMNYISNHELGEEGLKMVLLCKKYPEVKNCWKEIGAALPWRPCESVYYRAHILFERGKKRSWTDEEYELVQKFYEKYGSDWKTLAEALGKHRFHVKDTWRRIKFINRNRGRWSQDEYQTLFDLVNMDLRMKAFEEKKSKHGMLRDNICWTAISEKLGTRATAMCCMKWYDQLTSPMVAEGKWLDVDDYRLLIALYNVDACCMEDVDWDSLLEHRPGDVCRKRWSQMVKHLGEHKNELFADQVEVLIKRYCPNVLEAREVYDNKPAVD